MLNYSQKCCHYGQAHWRAQPVGVSRANWPATAVTCANRARPRALFSPSLAFTHNRFPSLSIALHRSPLLSLARLRSFSLFTALPRSPLLSRRGGRETSGAAAAPRFSAQRPNRFPVATPWVRLADPHGGNCARISNASAAELRAESVCGWQLVAPHQCEGYGDQANADRGSDKSLLRARRAQIPRPLVIASGGRERPSG